MWESSSWSNLSMAVIMQTILPDMFTFVHLIFSLPLPTPLHCTMLPALLIKTHNTASDDQYTKANRKLGQLFTCKSGNLCVLTTLPPLWLYHNYNHLIMTIQNHLNILCEHIYLQKLSAATNIQYLGCLLHIKSSKANTPRGFFLIPLQWAETGMSCIRLQLDKLICSCFWGCHQRH